MKKKILIISILIITTFTLYRVFRYDIREYLDSKKIIKWSENVKVNFKDYQGTPDLNDDYNIHNYHGIYLKANNLKDAYAVAFFNKEKSWIIDSTNVAIEEKELQKLRFDLHEYYARKINLGINKIKNDNSKKFEDLQNIYNKYYSELKEFEKENFENNYSTKEKIIKSKHIIDSLLKTTN